MICTDINEYGDYDEVNQQQKNKLKKSQTNKKNTTWHHKEIEIGESNIKPSR